MPVNNRIAELAEEVAVWRRDLHAHPELLYDLPRTSALVAERLRSFGVDRVETGIGRVGVVGVIEGSRGAGPSIGLRADMDALPILEATGKSYASQSPGRMHACGHDGHTAMLLGAARYLAETRNFAGRAIVVFQPAEEGGDGAKEMIEAGLMERFGIEEIYGLHNYPGVPVGGFSIRQGPLMAGSNQFHITITGRAGHAAWPHDCLDVVHAGSQLVVALQGIVARTVDPIEAAVISVAMFQAGNTFNILPDKAELRGTCRALEPRVLDMLERRMGEVVEGVGKACGVEMSLSSFRDSSPTINGLRQTEHALSVAREVSGADLVDAACPPVMGSEDFAYMLEKRPGAFIFLGNGDSARLHNPAYDFDDRAIPFGMSWLTGVVERRT